MAHDLNPVAEMPADHSSIEHLLDLSFGLSRWTKTSYRLREGSQPVEGLSLVIRDAEIGIAGAISYWPLMVGHAMKHAILLGPLAVHPLRQNMGVGLALMRTSLALAKEQGHKLVLLVGDGPYYARVGFQQLPDGLLRLPGPVDPKRFLYLELASGALEGFNGLVLAPWRSLELSAALAEPHR